MVLETLAFIFPGQGSQSVGMLAELASQEPLVQETFSEASDALGFDLWSLAQNGPDETQNLTENTQPLILTASVALWRLWSQRSEQRPAQMAGHSLGEFSALVCAGALPFAETVDLVRQRGQFMQTAVPVGVGAMAAIIGLGDEQINLACEQGAGDEVVSAVNYNSPGQVVIAGHAAAVQRASELCKEAGAKRALPLPVSAPFHTSLMQPAGEQLASVLQGIPINAPTIPVIHNVHAQAEQDAEKIRQLLVKQISSPVPWVSCVSALTGNGAKHLVECGPGKVLSGLSRRIDKTIQSSNLQVSDDFDGLIDALGV
ncbi:MAG: ACP S-malonyltransferase [Pseudomonadales bacterium]